MQKNIRKALIIQYSLGAIYVAAWALWNKTVLLSAIVGCLAGLIPNSYFYIRMGKRPENNDAQHWVAYAYRSEFGKWVIACMIFLLAFTSDHIWDPMVLFAGYSLILFSSWLVAFVLKGN